MKTFRIFWVLFFLSNPFAGAQPYSLKELCLAHRGKKLGQLLQAPDRQLSFPNPPGIIGKGSCFWHSRFTRNISYLAYFSPRKERPSRSLDREHYTPGSLEDLMMQIVSGHGPIEIPGYRNLREFSLANEKLIDRTLRRWQTAEAFLTPGVIWNAVKGKPDTAADKLERRMHSLFRDLQTKPLVFQILQHPGLGNVHSWLVLGIKQISNGYQIVVHDSDFLGAQTYVYQVGDTHLTHPKRGRFVPYSAYEPERQRIDLVIKRSCHSFF